MRVLCTGVRSSLIYINFNVVNVICTIIMCAGLIIHHQLLIWFVYIGGILTSCTVYNSKDKLMHTADFLFERVHGVCVNNVRTRYCKLQR